MNDDSLAAGDGEQETPAMTVDLDATGKDAVQRVKPQRTKPSGQKDWAAESAAKSKEMQKRLQRQARGFSQQLADQQAEFQRQLAERDARLARLEAGRGDAPAADEAAHQAAMEKLLADLEDAQERGDSKAVAKITAEMSRKEGQFWAAKAAKIGVNDRPNDQTRTAATGGVQQQQNGQAKPTKAGLAWAKANGAWWNDTTDEVACDARQYANTLYQRMKAEGEVDMEDPAAFEEIRKAVQKRFPEIETVSTMRQARRSDDDDDDQETLGGDDPPPARRAPPSLPNRGDATQRGNRQVITNADLVTMRKVGLDPDNDKHVVQFLRSKNEVAESEA